MSDERLLAGAGPSGFALVIVLLLMVGLAILATGLTFSAAQHATLAGSVRDVARARLAAEAAVSAAVDAWRAAERIADLRGPPGTPLGSTVELEPGVIMQARAERLAPDVFLLVGTGAVVPATGGAIRQRSARLIRSLDLDSLGRAMDAALIAAERVSVAPGAGVRGDQPDGTSADSTAAALCNRWPTEAAAIRAPAATVSSDAAVSGSPAVIVDPWASRHLDAIGFLDFARLAASARAVRESAVSPVPLELADGRCDSTGAGSWGGPSGPCAAHWPLLHAAADLRFDGGYAQGILLVNGDLALEGGARFRGLILVLGTATVLDAEMQGTLIAREIRMQGGRASLDRCAIASALAAPGILNAAHPARRSRIPAFD